MRPTVSCEGYGTEAISRLSAPSLNTNRYVVLAAEGETCHGLAECSGALRASNSFFGASKLKRVVTRPLGHLAPSHNKYFVPGVDTDRVTKR